MKHFNARRWPQGAPRAIDVGSHRCLPHKNKGKDSFRACRTSLFELPQREGVHSTVFSAWNHYQIVQLTKNGSFPKHCRVHFLSRTLTEAQEVSIVRHDLETPAVPRESLSPALFSPRGPASNGLSVLSTHRSHGHLQAKRLSNYLKRTAVELDAWSAAQCEARPCLSDPASVARRFEHPSLRPETCS